MRGIVAGLLERVEHVARATCRSGKSSCDSPCVVGWSSASCRSDRAVSTVLSAMRSRRLCAQPQADADADADAATNDDDADDREEADDEAAHRAQPSLSRTARGGAADDRRARRPSSPRRPARRECRRRDRGGPWCAISISLPLRSTVRRGVEDRARRLHREAHDDVLAGRDAAEDAAGIVREERDLAVAHAHLVGVLLAGERGRGEAGADLDALDRVDAHHRRGEIGVELVVDRLAQARRHAARPRPRSPRRSTSRPCARRRDSLPRLRHLPVGAPERIVLDRVPIPVSRGRSGAGPSGRARRGSLTPVAQDLARDRAGGDAHRGLARRGAAAAAIIADAVFRPDRCNRHGRGGSCP